MCNCILLIEHVSNPEAQRYHGYCTCSNFVWVIIHRVLCAITFYFIDNDALYHEFFMHPLIKLNTFIVYSYFIEKKSKFLNEGLLHKYSEYI